MLCLKNWEVWNLEIKYTVLQCTKEKKSWGLIWPAKAGEGHVNIREAIREGLCKAGFVLIVNYYNVSL